MNSLNTYRKGAMQRGAFLPGVVFGGIMFRAFMCEAIDILDINTLNSIKRRFYVD